MKVKKLSQGDIEEIQQLKSQENSLIQLMGETELKLISLNNYKDSLKAEFLSLLIKQSEVSSALQAQYGAGSIDIDKGEFIPASI